MAGTKLRRLPFAGPLQNHKSSQLHLVAQYLVGLYVQTTIAVQVAMSLDPSYVLVCVQCKVGMCWTKN